MRTSSSVFTQTYFHRTSSDRRDSKYRYASPRGPHAHGLRRKAQSQRFNKDPQAIRRGFHRNVGALPAQVVRLCRPACWVESPNFLGGYFSLFSVKNRTRELCDENVPICSSGTFQSSFSGTASTQEGPKQYCFEDVCPARAGT